MIVNINFPQFDWYLIQKWLAEIFQKTYISYNRLWCSESVKVKSIILKDLILNDFSKTIQTLFRISFSIQNIYWNGTCVSYSKRLFSRKVDFKCSHLKFVISNTYFWNLDVIRIQYKHIIRKYLICYLLIQPVHS